MSLPLPPTNALFMFTEDPEAKRHRKGRATLGTVLVILGVMKVLLLAWWYGKYGESVAALSEGERNALFVSDALGGAEAVVLIGAGFWNIKARMSPAKPPLMTAVVAAGLVILLDIISLFDLAITTGEMPNPAGLILHIAILVYAIKLLRFAPPPHEPPAPWAEADPNEKAI